MRQIPEVGDQVTLKKFSFTNKSGGTGMSDWKFDEQFSGEARVTVTSEWDDYEIGVRYIGTAESAALRAYLKRNAKPKDHRVFFGEFDIERIPA